MCRLFFSITTEKNNNEPKRRLLEFFHESNKDNIKDGFGISWLAKNKWHTIKRTTNYFSDPHIFNKIDKINSNVIIAHNRKINNNYLSGSELLKEKSIHNTHPISIGSDSIMHYGDLFIHDKDKDRISAYQSFKHTPGFKNKIHEIASSLQAPIDMKGNTDSEFILSIFSCMKYTLSSQHPSMNKEDIMVNSFLQTISLINNNKLVNRSNIFISSGDYIIISQIHINHTRIKKSDIKLYADNDAHTFTVSSYKFSTNAKYMKNNTAFIINHKLNTVKSFDILL